MDPNEEHRMAALLAAANRGDHLINVPRPGRNPEFDAYFRETFGDLDPETDVRELRRAAWRTWRTAAPSATAGASSRHLSRDIDDEDAELQRVLALSAEEHRAQQGTRDSPIVLDDEDETLQRAIAASSVAGPSSGRDIEDEEKRMMEEAIAASLRETTRTERERTASPADDDMEAALKASMASFEEERERKRQKTTSVASSRTSPGAEPTKSAPKEESEEEEEEGTLGDPGDNVLALQSETPAEPVGLRVGGLQIDRAQLERERLARQAARMGKTASSSETAKDSAPASSAASSSRVSSFSSNAVASSSKAPLTMAAAYQAATGASSKTSRPSSSSNGSAPRTLPPPLSRLKDHPLQSTGPFPRDAAGEYYVDGELRHVSLKIGSRSDAGTFSPKDVFGEHSQMSLLIISSFVWDNPWIDREFILPTPDVVPTIRITRPATGNISEMRTMQGKLQPMADGEVRSYPYMDGRQGSEHMKFAWIFYKTGRVRVSIMTANMVDYDWEQIENTVFIQDFLPTKASAKPDPDNLPDFPDQFRSLFNHLKIPKALKFLIANHPCGNNIPLEAESTFAGLCRYDWSRVQVQLVMSVSGKYIGYGKMENYGLGRLAKVVRDEGWVPQKGEKLAVEYQGSSLGAYASKWLNDFYHCCQGKDLQTMSRWKDDKKMPPVKVIFPSLATVDASVNGREGGGTMFCGTGFKRETAHLFHDANSKRGGVLMHTKMIIALFEPQANTLGLAESSSSGKRKADEITEAKDAVGGWIYVGSHNFSPSAWGTLNFNNKPPTLNISNYELGIVFPLPRSNANAVATNVAAHKRPARPYGKKDVPWSQKEHLK